MNIKHLSAHLCCQIVEFDCSNTVKDSIYDALCNFDRVDDTEIQTPAELADSVIGQTRGWSVAVYFSFDGSH